MKLRALIGMLMLAFATAAAAAPAPPTVRVEQPWIRWLPANLPAAGYAQIINDRDTTVRLVGTSSPDYGMVMLHHSRLAEGDSTMERVSHLDIPAHGSLKLKPGGYHLMLIHSTRAIKPGDHVKVTLKFAGGTTLQADFPVLPSASGAAH